VLRANFSATIAQDQILVNKWRMV